MREGGGGGDIFNEGGADIAMWLKNGNSTGSMWKMMVHPVGGARLPEQSSYLFLVLSTICICQGLRWHDSAIARPTAT